MEPLLNQLRDLPARFAALPAATRYVLIGGAVMIAVFALISANRNRDEAYEYAFTNLSTEDSAEASTLLRNSQMPFRLEANGGALAVPADKVHEVRLLLAAAGLPRGGGVGFELFDRGDLGVSEFTQKVNLRRALEGELARTISRLSEVRSARVHLTLAEHGLYRDEDRSASAAVVLNLKPNLLPTEREITGIRHLVASAVPGLSSESVTVVDGRGSVLAGEGSSSQGLGAKERSLSREYETQIVSLLEHTVGPGAAVARVSVQLDESEVSTNAEVVDPDQTAVRSERHISNNSNSDAQNGPANAGVAGAAGNQTTTAAGGTQTQSKTSTSNSSDDQTRNYDVTRTVTSTKVRGPRIKKLSVAILVDGIEGKPRAAADVARLGELAKRAVGFDAVRGDQFQISSEPFARAGEEAPPAPADTGNAFRKTAIAIAGAIGALALFLGLFFGLRSIRNRSSTKELELLAPGARIGEIESRIGGAEGVLPSAGAIASGDLARTALVDPATATRDRARELAQEDPVRAAALLRAWIESDPDSHVRPTNG